MHLSSATGHTDPDTCLTDFSDRSHSIPIEQAEVGDIRRKLESLPAIEQAKGLLMGFFGCDADAAFTVLKRWSSTRNVKLRLLCADLVAASCHQHKEPYGALREYLGTNGLTAQTPSALRIDRPEVG